MIDGRGGVTALPEPRSTWPGWRSIRTSPSRVVAGQHGETAPMLGADITSRLPPMFANGQLGSPR